jgi:hypothetical protein
MRAIPLLLVLAAAGVPASGQGLRILSEFQRVRPDGQVVNVDRVEKPREILSPAVVRNGWLTLRVVVQAPAGESYTLFIGQNPEDSARVALYQEKYTRVGEEWVADAVTPVKLPVGAALAPEQSVQTYLLDIFIPGTAPEGRFRLEAQLNVGDRWVIAPLEIRVQAARVSAVLGNSGAPAPPEKRADASLAGPVREYVCGTKEETASNLDREAGFTLRNARQDMALARQKEGAEGHEIVVGNLLRAAGLSDSKALCTSNAPAPRGAEWWLRFRDYLYQGSRVQ